MKTTTTLVIGIALTLLAGTGIVSGMPFDGFSDVDITDHTGEPGFGTGLDNAGDLNNDGYPDLVLGAYFAGKAFVYYGGPGFDNTSDVTIADHTGESGFSGLVENAGDLNGDGYLDLVIGANGAKKAFVYYGGPGFDGISDVDITDHTGELFFGSMAANAGDLNGDGYTDLVIGAYGAKKAFVYYGGPGFDGISDVAITDHLGEGGFGNLIDNAGDLNGDGYTDLVIGAFGAKKAFVYYGGPGFDGISDVDITDHIGESGFGTGVANAGDLSGDGYTDLVIGANGAKKAFVYYGGPGFDGISDVDITDHTGEDLFGTCSANAGDLNGDGYTDLVIGAFHAKKAFVYYGGPGFDGISDVDITDHTGETGFSERVANAGDLNDDGYTDLVIGAYLSNKAFVYYGGGPDFVASISVNTDKTTYTTGDIMDVEINISNPSCASQSVIFRWWLTIPRFGYMTTIATIPMTLPAGYDETFTFPIYVGYWGEESFGAVWGVALSDPETEEIISFDATYWNYMPSKTAKVKKSPMDIAKEMRKEIERVEFPS